MEKVKFTAMKDGDHNKRDMRRAHPCFDDCAAFCERWDQASFDPDYDDLPLEFFRPMVKRVFARTARDPQALREGVRVPLADAAVAAQRAAEMQVLGDA